MEERTALIDEPIVAEPEPERPVEQGPGFFETPRGRRVAIGLLATFAAGIFLFGFTYLRLARVVDRRLAAGAFSDTANIFTAPRTVWVGETATVEEVVAELRQSGYTVSRANTMGWYNVRRNAVEIFPGRDSYAGGDPGVVEFAGGKISRIVSLQDHTERRSFDLEPQLIANLSQNREKRRLVRYADIPQRLVNAVIATEDKHFFQHSGFDLFRIIKAAYVDMKQGRKEQGASTLTMQLARGLWLEPEKRWKRKIQELLITMHLEETLTKQKIFEYYANQIYLGRRGTFSVNGFGEAARAYFGTDLSQITTDQAALLAGLIQRPSFYNPYRYPERARDRRNLVLALMRQNQYLTEAEYRQAIAAPVKVAPEESGVADRSQYFVDLMSSEIQSRFSDREKHTRYIYTTIDPALQQAAKDAVRMGMELVDQQLRKGRKKTAAEIPAAQPQVALVALDPHTGAIRALVGGRDYGNSQLNHALAMRQPGSAFKPFVYAAALETGIQGGSRIFTPASVVSDAPTSFTYDRRVYEPANFHHQFLGDVTLRTALAHSLNVATVKVAASVGYDRVVSLARRAGMNEAIKPTPAVALGAYEASPLEVAGAYTIFANSGVYVKPSTVSLVRAPDGTVLYQRQAETRRAMDPRVAYLMVSMLQEVLRSGTGASVRSRGFTLPAAGKTGTSRDGWFAGFTGDLLCVVWVGFDDNRELNLEGARSALPIWTEFMKRASKLPHYSSSRPFPMPQGVLTEEVCTESGQLPAEYCTDVRSEVFISGSEPVARCPLHNFAAGQQFADRAVDLTETVAPANADAYRARPPAAPSTVATRPQSTPGVLSQPIKK